MKNLQPYHIGRVGGEEELSIIGRNGQVGEEDKRGDVKRVFFHREWKREKGGEKPLSIPISKKENGSSSRREVKRRGEELREVGRCSASAVENEREERKEASRLLLNPF